MKSVTVTGGCELTAAARNYLHERLGELEGGHALLSDVELIVKSAGKGYTVLLKGNLPRHGHCESKGTADSLHDAVNVAFDRFESRMRKQADRLQERRADGVKHTEARLAEVEVEEG